MIAPMTDSHRLPEIARAFLRLGLTSFGGPIAHLAYFREDLVLRRNWITDARYAEIVALSQFLPGPASSQTAFALGWQRGGTMGALTATLAFTLPSALAMILLAATVGAAAPDEGLAGGLIAGLKITAVAIVAHAVFGMARVLAPSGARAGIALAALASLSAMPTAAWMQVVVIAGGALAGLLLRVARLAEAQPQQPLRGPSRRNAALCAILFGVLLLLSPLLVGAGIPARIAEVFYRAGALVFGGGHVVLPLLEAGTVQGGLVPEASFLAGYGAAQAMPGPLFTFAGWLGQIAGGPAGAIIGLIAIFLPGFLLMAAALPFWSAISASHRARHAGAGANAAVVGVLGAALYDPVFTGGVTQSGDFALAVTLFLMLSLWRRPAWQVVITGALGGMALAL